MASRKVSKVVAIRDGPPNSAKMRYVPVTDAILSGWLSGRTILSVITTHTGEGVGISLSGGSSLLYLETGKGPELIYQTVGDK